MLASPMMIMLFHVEFYNMGTFEYYSEIIDTLFPSTIGIFKGVEVPLPKTLRKVRKY